MGKLLKLLLVTGSLFLLATAYAEVPRLINYQGRLTDKEGKPLENDHSIVFVIYDGKEKELWREAYLKEDGQGVKLQKGVFSVLLGSKTPLNLTFEEPYFLKIIVDGEEMKDKQQITSAGYAIRAENAESVDGVVKATKGLVVEARTSDPSSPETGQMWLRTDL